LSGGHPKAYIGTINKKHYHVIWYLHERFCNFILFFYDGTLWNGFKMLLLAICGIYLNFLFPFLILIHCKCWSHFVEFFELTHQPQPPGPSPDYVDPKDVIGTKRVSLHIFINNL